MATSPPDQIPESSCDASAVSIVVSNRSMTDPRLGAFANDDFAAFSPVYFQQLTANKFLGVFSQRWYDATLPANPTNPNLFSSRSIDSAPSWAIFDGANGNHYEIEGHYGFNPPTRIGNTGRTLIGACSRTNTYLYLLQSFTNNVTVDGIVTAVTFGVVSHYHINPVTWQVSLLTEDTIPSVTLDSGATVTFNKGIKYENPYVVFYGSDSSGNLYCARKNWGRIGSTIYPMEYQSDRGWGTSSSSLMPLKSTNGTNLTTAGPVSVITYHKNSYMSVVKNNSGQISAQVYCSKGLFDPWRPVNAPYSLGTSGTTYLGGTAYFQPALQPHPSLASVGGVPIVYSTKAVSGSNQGISISWDLWSPGRYHIDAALAITATRTIAATLTGP